VPSSRSGDTCNELARNLLLARRQRVALLRRVLCTPGATVSKAN
jgi:hypothetical protein